MADTKISADPAASALAGSELLAGVQSGGNVSITPDQIGDRVLAYLRDTDGTLAANSDSKFATQAATKAYVDASLAGLSWKRAARAASTASVTLATAVENGDTLDGVTLATGDRILLKNQSSASENGIWIVAASGSPSRATDADSSAELVNAAVYVSEGTTNADSAWTCTTNSPITVGSTSLTWAQFNGGGGITALTGDVTASGPGSAPATIANDAVTYAKLQNVSATSRVLGRKTAGAGDAEEVTLSEVLDFVGSAAQGDILYRGSATWTRLGAGTSGYYLQTQGAGANPQWAAMSGGGLTNFTEAVNTSSPNATVPVASLTATNAATDVDAAFKPKGAGAVTAHIADSTSTGGNKRGANASDWQTKRGNANQVASGAQSHIGGGENNRAAGQYSAVLCGLGCAVTGAYSSIGGGNGHTINHTYCFIGGGDSNTAGASASYMGILCGDTNTVSADWAAILGGRLNQATALYAAVINGNTALATGQYSVAQGAVATADGTYSQAWGRRAHTKGRYGAVVFATGSVADSATRWNQQYKMVLRKRTSDATPTRLTSNDSAQSATNSPSVELASAMTFQGIVTAVLGQGTNNQSKGWRFEGVIYRASSGNCALISAVTPVVIAETASATSWSIAVTADTTNQVLAVEVTGVSSTTIEWTCHINCVETISG